jgi:formylglycine-generating enzyme required for sulfatase activity
MGGMTMPVGSFPKGKCFYGWYDMAGNAGEWCQDWFTTNYFKLNGARKNPEGPTEEQAEVRDFSGKKNKARVLRGGAWASAPSYCRTVNRYSNAPSHRNYANGLRVAVAVSR